MNAFATNSSGRTSSPKKSPQATPRSNPVMTGLGVKRPSVARSSIGRRISRRLVAYNRRPNRMGTGDVRGRPRAAASSCRGACAGAAPAASHPFPASAGDPVRERDAEADEAAHDRPVQADELEVGAHPLLDLRDQGIRLERFEMLAHREPDLMVVATDQILRGGAHPAIEGCSPAGILEALEDARADRPVD